VIPEAPETSASREGSIEKSWRLRSSLDDLSRVQEEVQAFCASHNVPAEALHDVRIVLDEVLSNIIRHGYSEAEGEIVVKAGVSAERLTLEVRDRARPFNPLEAPEPDLHVDFADRPAGGVGIYIVRRLMDSVQYTYASGENLLQLERRIAT
jgi:serine/threonine-protein kinase RsbW